MQFQTVLGDRIFLCLSIACLLVPAPAPAQESKLYWAAADGLWRADLDGAAVERLAEGQIEALALDPRASKVYWGTRDTLHRADLDGRNVEEVPIPAGGAFSVAVDPRARKIYWVGRVDEGEGSSSTLHRADRNGANREVVLSLPRIAGLALDPRAETLYAATHAQEDVTFPPVSWAIVRIDTGSLDVETVLENGGIFPTFFPAINRLALDRLHGRIYWSEGGFSAARDGRLRASVWRAKLDGSNPEPLIGTLIVIPSIALDPPMGSIYWNEVGLAGITRDNFDRIIGEEEEQIVAVDALQVTDIALLVPASDFDRDGDVDLADLVTFQGCFSGAGAVPLDRTTCDEADLDFDGDVDLADLLTFQAHFTGPK